MDFNSHTDLVVARAVDLVNVVTPGEKQGRAYAVPADGALVAEISAVLGASEGSEVRPLVRIGAAAREVFVAAGRGDLDAAAEAANALLRRYVPTPELARHDGEAWHLHFHGATGRDPSGWGGGIAVALATVLGSEYAERLGVCEAPRCDRVFVDVSRNGTRRFCSTACQNRVKAAAHRARQAGGRP